MDETPSDTDSSLSTLIEYSDEETPTTVDPNPSSSTVDPGQSFTSTASRGPYRTGRLHAFLDSVETDALGGFFREFLNKRCGTGYPIIRHRRKILLRALASCDLSSGGKDVAVTTEEVEAVVGRIF